MSDQPTELLTLSSGVVLKVRGTNPYVIAAGIRAIPKPKVPRQMIEDKGREEENPTHPDYLAAMEAYELRVSQSTQDALFILGTEIESLPEGFSGPEDGEWIETLEASGVAIDPHLSKKQRYAKWINYWAIRSADDLNALATVLGRLNGTPEEAVADAVATFPGGEGGDPNPSVSDPPGSPDGDNIRDADRGERLPV